MKYLITLLAICVLCCSCGTSTQILVQGKPGTEVYAPTRSGTGVGEKLGEIGRSGNLQVAISDDTYYPYLLSKSQSDDIFVPFALDYKHKTRIGAHIAKGAGWGLYGLGMGATVAGIVMVSTGNDIGGPLIAGGLGSALAGIGVALVGMSRTGQLAYENEYKYLDIQRTNQDLTFSQPIDQYGNFISQIRTSLIPEFEMNSLGAEYDYEKDLLAQIEKQEEEKREQKQLAKAEKKRKRGGFWRGFFSGMSRAANQNMYATNPYAANPYASMGGSVIAYTPQSAQNQLQNIAAMTIQNAQMQEFNEYQQFSLTFKKPDGSDYSMDEWRAQKGAAITQMKEDGYDIIAETREAVRQQRAESEETRKRDRQAHLESYGYSTNDKTSGVTTSSIATTASTINNRNSSSKDTNTSSSNITKSQAAIDSNSKDKGDTKQQYHVGNVSSGDYHFIKKVTLYYRDGSKARDFIHNAELCEKGGHKYVKIGDKYFASSYSNWSMYSHAVSYGGQQIYYNE